MRRIINHVSSFNRLPLFLFSLLLTMQSPAARAAVLISPGILNGSFENPGGAVFSPADWGALTLSNGNPGTTEARGNNASHGSASVLIGSDNSDTAENFNVVANTNQTGAYTISPGESYMLSFDHIGLFNWVTGDPMRYSLFYTADDTLSGVTYQAPNGLANSGEVLGATVLFSDTVSVTEGTYNATGSITTAAVADAGAVGRHLFLAFTSAADDNEFARVDNVNLVVIPEPASILMLLLGFGTLCVFRSGER